LYIPIFFSVVKTYRANCLGVRVLQRMQKMIQAISLDGYIWIWHLIIFIVVIGWLGISDDMSGHTFFNMENSIMSGLLILMLTVYGIDAFKSS
ncbi:MAG: hypothetical protein ABF820_13725, partial [Sporolactobacillus sp.]